MSQENVEIATRLADALSAREVPGELLAPGFRMENVVNAVTDKTYYGAAGAREWIRDMFEGFAEGARFEIERVIADSDTFVVARVALVGSGSASGAPLRLGFITVVWLDAGKVVRTEGHASRSEALKAVGLEE